VLGKCVFFAVPLDPFYPDIKRALQYRQINVSGAIKRLFNKSMIDTETLPVVLCQADSKSTPREPQKSVKWLLTGAKQIDGAGIQCKFASLKLHYLKSSDGNPHQIDKLPASSGKQMKVIHEDQPARIKRSHRKPLRAAIAVPSTNAQETLTDSSKIPVSLSVHV
jgi:hypothetical protein